MCIVYLWHIGSGGRAGHQRTGRLAVGFQLLPVNTVVVSWANHSTGVWMCWIVVVVVGEAVGAVCMAPGLSISLPQWEWGAWKSRSKQVVILVHCSHLSVSTHLNLRQENIFCGKETKLWRHLFVSDSSLTHSFIAVKTVFTTNYSMTHGICQNCSLSLPFSHAYLMSLRFSQQDLNPDRALRYDLSKTHNIM